MTSVHHSSEQPNANLDLTEKLRQTYLQHEAPHPPAEEEATSPIPSPPDQSPLESSLPEAEVLRAELEQLQQTHRELQKQHKELQEQYLRLAADFDNYRKRMTREQELWAETLTEQLLRQLLPIADQLSMALDASASTLESLRQGVELIARNFQRLLEQLGVKPIEVTPGQPFDVYRHEAVLQLPSNDIPAGHVVKEVQRGYFFRDRVLRYARVAVSVGPQSNHQSIPSEESTSNTDANAQ